MKVVGGEPLDEAQPRGATTALSQLNALKRKSQGRFAFPQGQYFSEAGQDVGWDQRRFAAPAHHDLSAIPDGGPALEASWSHPTLTKAMAWRFSSSRDRRHSQAIPAK